MIELRQMGHNSSTSPQSKQVCQTKKYTSTISNSEHKSLKSSRQEQRMAYLMPTTKGHVFWISQTNGANLSRITKKEHYMLGDVTKSWYFLSKMETKKLYKNKVSKYLGKMDEYPIIMSRTLKRWRADSWIIWRISWCILLKTAWTVRLYAAARRNSSIDWRRKRFSIWSTSHLSTTFHENTKNNEL